MRARALRRPTPAELHEAFLWSQVRTADKTASVSLFGNHYEIDAALAGAKVELVFDPLRGIPRKGSYVRPRIMAAAALDDSVTSRRAVVRAA